MVRKVQRELWSTPTDALDLITGLKDKAGCYVKWETDDLHQLKHVFWSTGQQQVDARHVGRSCNSRQHGPDEQVRVLFSTALEFARAPNRTLGKTPQ